MVEVRITYASRVFSFPDRAVSVEDIADVVQNTSSGRSVSFSDLQFPVDVAELVAAGHDMSLATGEVLVNDVVILSGSVSEPQYGRAGDPVSLTVSDEPYNDRGIFPVNTVLEVVAPMAAFLSNTEGGLTVPFVFGKPALWVDIAGDVQSRAGSPALVEARTPVNLQAFRLVVNSVPVDGLTHVGIIDSQANRERFPVFSGNNGMPSVLINGASVIGITEEYAPYFVDYQKWSTTPQAFGRDGRAGEMIALLLSKSTLRIDWGRFERARGVLNRYLLAGYFDAPASPWQLINDHFNPILPISWISGIDGIYCIAWDLDARATGRITNENRVSMVTYEGDVSGVVNQVVLKYTRAAHNGTYRRHLTLRDEQSIAKYGELSETITCDICSDKDTAYRIARQILALKAWVHRSISYEMENPPPVGSVISLTDSDLHLTNEKAIVSRVSRGSAPASRVDVLLITKGAMT